MGEPNIPKAMQKPRHVGSDVPFVLGLAIIGSTYVLLIVALIVADAAFTTPGHLLAALDSPQIRYAIKLSLVSSSITAILSVWFAVPLGYLMSRFSMFGQGLTIESLGGGPTWGGWLKWGGLRWFKHSLDAVLDIPIVLPPLVIGLSLLILFRTPIGQAIESVFPVTYAVPSVILAQFSVACAFAVRTMRVTFDQINPRSEQVALTLGCSRSQAFWMVALPEARRGILTAATLAWARALGEFGPILVFAGATRMKTEVLPATVWLELSVGSIEGAVAVSLLMVIAAVLVLIVARAAGADAGMPGAVQ
jgi:molybdate transport system permease protein